MVNCIHFLYQRGVLTKEQMYGRQGDNRLFWCSADTGHPLQSTTIVVTDARDGSLSLSPAVYNLVDMVESQLRSMPKPDYAFGYPISAAIRERGEMRPAFLAISYAPEFDAVKQTVLEAAAAARFRCEVTGDLSSPGPIMDQVWSGIRAADVVVADVTGMNPNVFYEVGLAHALGKEVIVLTQDSGTPFDIRHFRRIEYGANDLARLRLELTKAFGVVSPRYPFEGAEPRF